ncbi:pyridoxal phosphate-dependent aminotransferase [Anaerocolumna xylanovorans]|uniref:Aminotransferase n=1 Tax=Anaerocolumna xylanovorans DSM 12503 TaxID=1121345 RepID=A0A1M7YH03_9FIRM|nr:threonine-phosphate decarboxylase [Anaerocolumna xylanovorans]SHO51937.1 threonine-phosphate decarboxylase [Anaerocolumna xylanovorans DSM 12503]
MINPKEHFHGSDLEKIEKYYGIKKEDIINFAGNVNPLGISPVLRRTLSGHIDAITDYPDREYTSLRKSIAAYVNKDMQSEKKCSIEHILVGNGSTELISLFIQFIKPKKALILSPTYSEYERELTLGGSRIEYFPLKKEENFIINLPALKESLDNSCDLFVICNPNNPTSSAIDTDTMAEILSFCRDRNIYCMVDETYVEFTPDISCVTSVSLLSSYKNLIVIRGISKFFAAPGLRLGYALVSDDVLISLVNERKNPWTINILASLAGEIMFSDEEYIKETRSLISGERNRIKHELDRIPGLKYYEPAANFILLQIKNADLTSHDLFERAIRKSMMIRDCSTFTGLGSQFIRFCFLTRENNDKLLDCLKEI